MKNILNALAMLMEQHRITSSSHEATKALTSVADKIGRIDGKKHYKLYEGVCL